MLHIPSRPPPKPRIKPPRRLRLLSLLPLPSLFIPPLPPRPHIPSTSTTTTKTKLHNPSHDTSGRSNPHKRKHFNPDIGRDIEFGDGCEHIAEDDEEDGGDYGGDGGEECGEEGEEHDAEGPPAGEDGDGLEGDHKGYETGAGEEEAEHPFRDGFDEAEVGG